MTQQEIADKIILELYNKKYDSYKEITEILNDIGINSEEIDLYNLSQKLKNEGYVTTKLNTDGSGLIVLNSIGIDYIEKQNSPVFSNSQENAKIMGANQSTTPNFDESNNDEFEIDIDIEGNDVKIENKKFLVTSRNESKIITSNIEPCYGVENIAKHFVDLMGKLDCDDDKMIGVFGSWGRGKTYFYKKVEKLINKQQNKEEESKEESKDIKYDFVEFNAWKYQETPAIWAYLFETFFKAYGGWWKRLRYSICRNKYNILLFVILFFIIIIGEYIFIFDTNKGSVIETFKSHLVVDTINSHLAVDSINSHSAVGKIKGNFADIIWNFKVSILSSIIMVVIAFFKLSSKTLSAFNLIKKYSKPVSFNSVLGIQAEIEKELSRLLEFWIKNKKTNTRKIILFIDDIDRCYEGKMISIIDSLRTVLENKIIRDRLIIICAIDDSKLKKAITHKYKDVYNQDSEEEKLKLKKIVNEQIDKIFITGIKIPSATPEENMEFIKKLIGNKGGDDIGDNQTIMDEVNDNTEDEDDILNYTAEILNEFNPDEIKRIFNKILNDSKYDKVTPRQLRIIYYRVLFYNNLVVGSTNIDFEKIIRVIFDKTMCFELENRLINGEISMIDMVVPY